MPSPETQPSQQGTQDAVPSPETTQHTAHAGAQPRHPHQEKTPTGATAAPTEVKAPTLEFKLGSNLQDAMQNIRGLIDTPNAEVAQNVIAMADQFNTQFRQQYEKEENKLTREERIRITDWIKNDESDAGQHLLEQAARAITELMGSITRKGVPGQDRYHMLEDLRSEVMNLGEYAASGKADGFQKLAAIPAAFHDIGRLWEEAVMQKTTGGEDGHLHAKLSGWILNGILKHIPSIPLNIRQQMVHAALAHQEWNPEKNEMTKYFTNNEPTSQEVLKIERSGLVGAHAIERMIAYDVGAQAAKSLDFVTKINPERQTKLVTPKDNTDLFHHIEFYMRNLFPVTTEGAPDAVNRAMTKRVEDAKAISGAFLYLASTDEVRQQIFAPEMARDRGEQLNAEELIANKKKLLSPELWNAIKNKVRQVENSLSLKTAVDTSTLEQLAEKASGLKLEDPAAQKALGVIKQKLAAVTDPEAQKRLAFGLAFAEEQIRFYKTEGNKAIQKAVGDKKNFTPHSVERILADYAAKELGVKADRQGNQREGNKERNGNRGNRRDGGRNNH